MRIENSNKFFGAECCFGMGFAYYNIKQGNLVLVVNNRVIEKIKAAK